MTQHRLSQLINWVKRTGNGAGENSLLVVFLWLRNCWRYLCLSAITITFIFSHIRLFAINAMHDVSSQCVWAMRDIKYTHVNHIMTLIGAQLQSIPQSIICQIKCQSYEWIRHSVGPLAGLIAPSTCEWNVLAFNSEKLEPSLPFRPVKFRLMQTLEKSVKQTNMQNVAAHIKQTEQQEEQLWQRQRQQQQQQFAREQLELHARQQKQSRADPPPPFWHLKVKDGASISKRDGDEILGLPKVKTSGKKEQAT